MRHSPAAQPDPSVLSTSRHYLGGKKTCSSTNVLERLWEHLHSPDSHLWDTKLLTELTTRGCRVTSRRDSGLPGQLAACPACTSCRELPKNSRGGVSWDCKSQHAVP